MCCLTPHIMSLPLCTHFQRGKCQYGPNCRRSHVLLPPASVTTKVPERACMFYTRGQCTKGDTCPYRLIEGAVESVRALAPPTAFGPCAFFLKGECSKGQECSFPHPTGRNPACRFHLNGSCRFGAKCSSSHDNSASGIRPSAATSAPKPRSRPVAIRSPDGEAKSLPLAPRLVDVQSGGEVVRLLVFACPLSMLKRPIDRIDI